MRENQFRVLPGQGRRQARNNMWAKFIKSFHESEVIFFARLQVFLGVLAAVAIPIAHVVFSIDLSPMFSDPRYLVAWLFISGLMQEFLRKHREDWGMDKQDPDDDPNEGGHARNDP